jgi:hypothetical protein
MRPRHGGGDDSGHGGGRRRQLRWAITGGNVHAWAIGLSREMYKVALDFANLPKFFGEETIYVKTFGATL